MGNVLITLIIVFVMLKIDIVTQLGHQLIWTYPHLSFALWLANVHSLQVTLRLWNNQDSATRSLTSLCKFKNQLYKKYIDQNSRVDHFTISRNFLINFLFLTVFLLHIFAIWIWSFSGPQWELLVLPVIVLSNKVIILYS